MAETSPVARMMDAAVVDEHGKPDHSGRNAAQVWIQRESGSTLAMRGSLLYLGDVLKTSHFTVAVFEFLIGGRVGINRNTAVEIVTERSVADYGMTFGAGLKKSAGLWLNSGDLKRPLEIQTNGGAMGIKG